ncbi:hypothetical protein MUCCIDRAFT_120175, partial [Mucor lusitanicus CBS 277.49]
TKSDAKLKCLVIDTNAIINGMSLRNMAEEFYTCPEVLYELRSAHSREFLSRLPFELKILNPTEEAMKFVTEFSKKTGDYGVLSQPDLRVLALTYTLEKRENGDANILKKEEPKKEEIKEEEEKLVEAIQKVDISHDDQKTPEIPLTEDQDDSDSDGGEWITPDNVDEYKAAEIGVTADELKKKAIMAVGCMTADFAMQNVLLQMNLNLVSAGGYRVKKIRNSVMRCHACFFVTNDLEKKFCPKCGNATLQRVTCSTNSKGEIAYHLKKNFQYRLRGTVYDIPPPKGGRKSNNIVLREDQ